LREILTGRELEHHLETEVNCIPRERFASVCKTAWKRAVLGGSATSPQPDPAHGSALQVHPNATSTSPSCHPQFKAY